MQNKKYTLSSKLDYENPYYKIFKEKIKFPNGYVGDYYVLRKNTGMFSGIIAFYKGKLIIIRNWRPTIGDWSYEFPIGGVDEGEDSLTAAKREFFEETGYKAKKWQKLTEIYTAPGHTDGKLMVYVASEVEMITGKAEDNPAEVIKVELVSIDEFEQMIKDGKINDGPTLSAWLMYKSIFN